MVSVSLKQLKAILNNDKYLPYEQDGKTYNLYDMPDGFIIRGNVDLKDKELTELPDLSKVIVEGCFECQRNRLISLKGAPQKVAGFFDCHENSLVSLEGAPKEVGGSFYCYQNYLATMDGAPQVIGGDFNCDYNKLSSLKGAPQKVGGEFNCSHNPWLESLYGISAIPVGGKIYCNDELGEKYGFSDSQSKGFVYEDLIKSQVYKNEVLIDDIIRKKHTKEHEDIKTQNHTQFKAGYAAFKKKQAEERE